MKQQTHILYLSGFGDGFDRWRLRLLKMWRYRNVTVELVPMKWDTGTFEQKIARIDRAIDQARGKQIVIIGESAGGSMAVHMYARRPDDLYRVMTLCGKNTHPETVGERYFRRSPAFKRSMELLNDSLESLTTEQKRQFVSIHPFYDATVPIDETMVPGCRNVRLWTAGHRLAIYMALTVYSWILVRQAKKPSH